MEDYSLIKIELENGCILRLDCSKIVEGSDDGVTTVGYKHIWRLSGREVSEITALALILNNKKMAK